MTKGSIVLNNFTTGKVDTDFNGRFDLGIYQKGFKNSKNFISNYIGVLKNRPGFEFVDNIGECVLKEFKFNTEQAYLMAFTNGELSFYTYDKQGNLGGVKRTEKAAKAVNAALIGDITSNRIEEAECTLSDSKGSEETYKFLLGADNKEEPYPSFQYDGNDYIEFTFDRPAQIFSLMVYTQHNPYNKVYQLKRLHDGEWVDDEKIEFGTERDWWGFNDRPDESRKSLKWRIYFVSGNLYNPKWLSFNFSVHLFEIKTENTLKIGTNFSLDIAKTLKFAQNGDVMFISSKHIRPMTLTRTASDTFVLQEHELKGIDFNEYGNPIACAFYGGRLWYGGFDKKPITVCGSRVADYDDFEITKEDMTTEDPIHLTASEISDPILWLVGGKDVLNAGNAEGISVISGSGGSISYNNISFHLANREGSNSVQPEFKDGFMFYSSTDGRKVYSYQYDLLTESFVSTDNTMLVKDVTHGGIKRIVYKKDNNDLMYIHLGDGRIVAYLKKYSENINAFYPYELYGNVEDAECITRPDGKKDLFVVVYDNKKRSLLKLSDEVEFKNYAAYDIKTEEELKNAQIHLNNQLNECNYLDNSSKYTDLHEEKITIGNKTTYLPYEMAGFVQDLNLLFYDIESQSIKMKDEKGFIKVAFPADNESGYYNLLVSHESFPEKIDAPAPNFTTIPFQKIFFLTKEKEDGKHQSFWCYRKDIHILKEYDEEEIKKTIEETKNDYVVFNCTKEHRIFGLYTGEISKEIDLSFPIAVQSDDAQAAIVKKGFVQTENFEDDGVEIEYRKYNSSGLENANQNEHVIEIAHDLWRAGYNYIEGETVSSLVYRMSPWKYGDVLRSKGNTYGFFKDGVVPSLFIKFNKPLDDLKKFMTFSSIGDRWDYPIGCRIYTNSDFTDFIQHVDRVFYDRLVSISLSGIKVYAIEIPLGIFKQYSGDVDGNSYYGIRGMIRIESNASLYYNPEGTNGGLFFYNNCDYFKIPQNIYTCEFSKSTDIDVESYVGKHICFNKNGKKYYYEVCQRINDLYGLYDTNNLTHSEPTGEKGYALLKMCSDTEQLTGDIDEWNLSFEKLEGLEDFEGYTVSVVADGGYLGDFKVDETGVIFLPRYCLNVNVGLKYDCFAETFNIGQSSGQMSNKNVYNATVRSINSVGGKIGTDIKNMHILQEIKPYSFFDMQKIEETDKNILIEDSSDNEKKLYIEQNIPLPLKISVIKLDIDYRSI